jgi:hypothetical protein
MAMRANARTTMTTHGFVFCGVGDCLRKGSPSSSLDSLGESIAGIAIDQGFCSSVHCRLRVSWGARVSLHVATSQLSDQVALIRTCEETVGCSPMVTEAEGEMSGRRREHM